MLPVPLTAGPGKPVDPRVIADNDNVKAVVINLRGGAVLPEHSTPHAVAIQALSGSGEMRISGATEKLSPGRLLLLEPGVPHDVRPDAGSDMVLLVLHLKKTGAAAPGGGHDHH